MKTKTSLSDYFEVENIHQANTEYKIDDEQNIKNENESRTEGSRPDGHIVRQENGQTDSPPLDISTFYDTGDAIGIENKQENDLWDF